LASFLEREQLSAEDLSELKRILEDQERKSHDTSR